MLMPPPIDPALPTPGREMDVVPVREVKEFVFVDSDLPDME